MKILYHGSKTSGIKKLKPSLPKALRGSKRLIFATSDRAYALSMIHGTGDELAVMYAVNADTRKIEMFIDELEPGKLDLLSQEGYLYEVESKYFKESPEKLEGEFVSYNPVPVVKENKIDNVLGELKRTGVNLVKYDDVPESMGKRGRDVQKPEIEHPKDRFK